jgi:peptidyl-prolyl cis-trans isomerase D
MRASAKWIMGIVALAFVGWLVFDVGMDVGGRGGSPTFGSAVARVDGDEVDAQTFYARVRYASDQQRQAGTPILTMDEQRDLEDQVLEAIVQELVLVHEYERRGIAVTDNEIREAALSQPLPELMQLPEFQTEGQFDMDKYQRYLRAQQDLNFMLYIESRYREEIPRLKLYERLTSDVYVPEARLWRVYQDQTDSVAADLITIFPQAAIRDDQIEVTEEDLVQYYREHSDDYARPARVHLSYARVSRIPDAADSAVALERAQSIRAELRDGADFAELAARESADSVSRQNGGDLGDVELGRHVSEFADAAMALRAGQISDPVLTAFGYHIIRLQSKTQTGYHASHILIPIELQGEHLRQVEVRGDSLDLYAAEQTDPTLLDSVASDLGVAVDQAQPLQEGMQLRIDGSIIPDVGVWAFEAFEGEISHVIETTDYYYVFRLDQLDEEGVPPLDAVRADVTRDVSRLKKWDEAEKLAAQVDGDLRSGMPFEEAANTHGLRMVSLPPFTRLVPNPALMDAPTVVGAAFGLDLGETSGPLSSEQAIYFIRPTQKQLADSTAFAEGLDALRNQVLTGARQARVQFILQSLRANATVDDLRKELALQQRAQQDQMPQTPFGF